MQVKTTKTIIQPKNVTRKTKSKQMRKGNKIMFKSQQNRRMNRPLPSQGSLRQAFQDMNISTPKRSERKATYLDSVAVPEYAQNAKIPSYSPLPTNAMHMKSTIKFTSSITGSGPGGEAAIVVNPYYLCDNNNTTTNILINNSAALITSTGTGAGAFVGTSMISRLTASTANAYRLVSASIHIYPEISALNAQGYIAGGVVTYAGQPDSYTTGQTGYGPFSAASATASILDQAMYYQKAQIGNQAGVRCVYVPFDPSFEFFCQPNSGRASLLTTNCDQFYWNYYVTGSVPGSSFVCELYYNFELEPNPSGVLQLLATPREFDDTERGLIKELIRNPMIISQSNSNLLGTAQAIDSRIRTGERKTGNFLAKSLAWLSENSANITNFLSMGARML